VEAFLRHPGHVLDELQAEMSVTPEDPREAERHRLKAALADQRAKRERTADLATDGLIEQDECAHRLGKIDAALGDRSADSESRPRPPDGTVPLDDHQLDLLEQIRQGLDEGLTEQQWQELASLPCSCSFREQSAFLHRLCNTTPRA